MKISVMKRFFSLLIALSLLLIMAACGGTNTADKPDVSSNVTAKTEASTQGSEKTFDPMAKYDTPVEISCAFLSQSIKFNEGESWENNIFTRAYENDLGIKIKVKWEGATQDDYNQKMNIAIASNDMPDIASIYDKNQYIQALNAGYATDMTDVFDQYVTPLAKEIITQDTKAFDTSKVKGRLMSIPSTNSAVDGIQELFVRKDWMDKLGISAPKTMDDLVKISEAFTKNDPDGNNKADTYGFLITKALYDWCSIIPFMNGYHAYPQAWIKDSGGKLVYGSVQPEVKNALIKLQEMYKAGLIDPEFGVKDATKVSETAVSGKAGMYYGAMWTPLWPLQQGKDQDAKSDWVAFPIVSADDKPAQPLVNVTVDYYQVVRKGFEYPEAAVKLLNEFIEKEWGNTADVKYMIDPSGVTIPHQYAVVKAWPPLKNLTAQRKNVEALNSKDPSKLNTEEKGYYDTITKFLNGDNKGWATYRVFGPEGSSFSVIDQYVKSNGYIYNEFYGSPTKTMAEKWKTLNDMEVQTFIKIIMGDPIDQFDQFVKDWNSLGGTDITREVNEWATGIK